MAEILIIDDEEPVRFMLRLALEKAGYSVQEADTGRKAVLMVEQSVPDLIVTDIIMPDKEGLETIIEIRNKHPEVPIFAMSGGGRMENKDYLDLAKRFGAEKVFPKPFDTAEMIDAVAVQLGESKTGAGDAGARKQA